MVLTATLAGSGWAEELRVGAVGDYQPFNLVGEDVTASVMCLRKGGFFTERPAVRHRRSANPQYSLLSN